MGKYKNAGNNKKTAGVSFIALFELPFLYLSEKVFRHIPKCVRIPEEPWKDIFCYNTSEDEKEKSYIEIYTANGGETNEKTYPIAKDFITKVFSPYHMVMRIEGESSFTELYHRFLSEYNSEKSFFDKEKGVIYILCDEIKPIFEILARQSEYCYCFDVCAFAELPHIENYVDAQKLMSEKSGLLHIECKKQHDEIRLCFDDNVFFMADLLKTFRECCEQHDRRFMTSEEIGALYP